MYSNEERVLISKKNITVNIVDLYAVDLKFKTFTDLNKIILNVLIIKALAIVTM